ncbi:MAG: FAD-dependent oxidoreductase [Deltaproteobacteria bacterium]|nr:FAD-dependent oxidoreductase [Deltaproteobacteria bacterium]
MSQAEAGASPGRPSSVAIVERIEHHTADTRSLFLRPTTGPLAFLPGQFLSLLLPVDGAVLTRPYSIASRPEDNDLLEICLNEVPGGRGSHYLCSLAVGAQINFTGPWGTFTLDQPPAAACIFLADGTGIAPMRPMMRRVLESESSFPVHLLYRAEDEAHLLYRNELLRWTRQHLRFVFESMLPTPPDGWTGLRGTFLEQVEARYVSGDADRGRHFYICGVGPAVTQLRDLLRGAGYQRRAVQYEKW